jgi:glycosyltransferase involved in cell wall biosynthesis
LAGVPGASLVILGTGPLQGELEELARVEGVDERLALPGTRADARAIMAGADAVVLPSRWEGLPLVGLEALAAKTPLVATAARGIREVFEDGVHCILVEPEPGAMADGIRRVLADHRLAGRLVTAGAALAASYSDEVMAERFDSLYGEVAGCPV